MKILLLTLDNLEFPSPQIRLLEPIRALNEQVQIFNGMHLLQQGATSQQLFAPIDLVIVQEDFLSRDLSRFAKRHCCPENR